MGFLLLKIPAVICFCLSLVCGGWGIFNLFTNDRPPEYVIVTDHNAHPENEGKYVLMTGTPTYSGFVEDPQFGVKVKSPLLQRKVEMYQYLYNGTSEKATMYKGWSSKYQSAFTDRFKRRYSNPSFPENLRSEDFGGELTFNNGTLKLDKEYSPKLGYSSYVDFKDSFARNLRPVTKLQAYKLPENYINKGNSYYLPKNPEYQGSNPQIGDIRITYKGLILKDLPEFTIIGKQVNDVIKYADNGHLVDQVLTDDELKRFYRSTSRSAFFGALFCSVLLLGAGIYFMTY